MTIAAEARDYLVGLLGSDRGATRGEIAKLILYARGKQRIEIEDVEAIVADAAPSTLDATIDAALLGDRAGLEAGAGRYFADGGDPGFLVTRLAQRLTLLHRLRLEMEARQELRERRRRGRTLRMSPTGARRAGETGGALVGGDGGAAPAGGRRARRTGAALSAARRGGRAAGAVGAGDRG